MVEDEDEGGLGRGVLKRVRTNRTTGTKWAKDGKGDCNNNT